MWSRRFTPAVILQNVIEVAEASTRAAGPDTTLTGLVAVVFGSQEARRAASVVVVTAELLSKWLALATLCRLSRTCPESLSRFLLPNTNCNPPCSGAVRHAVLPPFPAPTSRRADGLLAATFPRYRYTCAVPLQPTAILKSHHDPGQASGLTGGQHSGLHNGFLGNVHGNSSYDFVGKPLKVKSFKISLSYL